TYNWKDKDGKKGPSYRCVFQEAPASREVPNCADIGVLGVLPGILGVLQANEVIKIISGIGKPLSGKLLLFDALRMEFRTLAFSRDERIIKGTRVLDEYIQEGICMAPIREISAAELKAKLDAKDDIFLLDVREPQEREISNIGGTLIPMGSVAQRVNEI